MIELNKFQDEQFINNKMRNLSIAEIISIDKDILSGQPVFKGTRVPIETLFDHLEAGISLGEFLSDFPSVSHEQAITLLDMANKIMTSKNIASLYEAIA